MSGISENLRIAFDETFCGWNEEIAPESGVLCRLIDSSMRLIEKDIEELAKVLGRGRALDLSPFKICAAAMVLSIPRGSYQLSPYNEDDDLEELLTHEETSVPTSWIPRICSHLPFSILNSFWYESWR